MLAAILGAALDGAFGDLTACNLADLGDGEDLADFGIAEHGLADARRGGRCRALEVGGAHEARAAWAAPRGFVSCLSGARSRRRGPADDGWARCGRALPSTPPTKGAASLGAAEMGQATRRELALGLRSAEASLAATRGRSRRRRGGAGARETQRRRLPSRSALGALDLLSRLGPRAVTASMLRRSLPFQPTLLAISSSNARALPTSPPALHVGSRPSPADLVGQAVRLR